MRRVVIIACLLFRGAALASPGLTLDAEAARLALELPSGGLTLARQGSSLQGQDVSLQSSPRRLTGTALGRAVELNAQRGRVAGHIGAQPVALQVSREADALVVRGTVGSDRVDYRGSPQRLRGAVGSCTWSLSVAARRYAGWFDCGRSEVPLDAELVLPPWFGALTDSQQAMLLTVVLSPSAAAAAPLGQDGADLDQILLNRLGLALANRLTSLPGGLQGVRIERVVPNTPAARAGLQVGSVLTGIGLEPVRRADDARVALLRMAPGASVVVRLARPGEAAWSAVNLVRPP